MTMTAASTLLRVPGKASDLDPKYYEAICQVVKDIYENTKDPHGSPWTTTSLGEALGLSQTQVSDLKNFKPGKGFGAKTLIALSDWTGRSIDDLLGRASAGPPSTATSIEQAIKVLQSVQETTTREAQARATQPHVSRMPYQPPPQLSAEELEREFGRMDPKAKAKLQRQERARAKAVAEAARHLALAKKEHA